MWEFKVEKPQFEAADVGAFIREAYGLDGTATLLPSERDRNFRIAEPQGSEWVAKIVNRQEPRDTIVSQIEALEHVAKTDPGLPCPRLRRNLQGLALTRIEDGTGSEHWLFVLSYLPGDVVGEKVLDARQLMALGALAARLGRALRGFTHAGPARRGLIWDNRLAPRLIEQVGLLGNKRHEETAHAILDTFRDRVLPRLERLRAQVVHGDLDPYNTLLDRHGGISGLIDFGDLVHAPLIQDLANLVAQFLQPGQDIAETILSVVRGYRCVTELEAPELDVLLETIEVRLLMTPLINRIRAANGSPPGDDLINLGERCFPLIEQLARRRQSLLGLVHGTGAPAADTTQSPPLKADEMLRRRVSVMGSRLHLFYQPPLHLVRGDGVWLYDADGRRYLDCYNNVPHVGHCHPRVAEAIARQARQLNTNTRYVTDQAVAYAERLVETAHPNLSVVAYVNSGSEANDVAWRMAKAWTGKSGGLVMDFAYHGITEAVDALSPANAPNKPLAPHIRALTPPDGYRGPFRRGESGLAARYADLADQPISSLAASGHGVAAVIVDSAFMTNGMLEAPPGYLQSIAEKARAAGGVFIADEVQSGFGRMGTHFWGHQHHGVEPDIITIGKPAGNGHPLGVVVTRPEILDRFMTTASFFSTFGGNNVSCAAGLAVLDVIRDEQLVENAKTTGAYFKAALLRLKDQHDVIGDVRGTGLALGMELVRDRKSLEPAPMETRRLLNLIRDEGVLVGSEGKLANIVKIRPPIVFNAEHADLAAAAIDRALRRL